MASTRECRCPELVARCVHARGRVVRLYEIEPRGWKVEWCSDFGYELDIWCFPIEHMGREAAYHDAVSTFEDWVTHLLTAEQPMLVRSEHIGWDHRCYTDPERYAMEVEEECADIIALIRRAHR